MNKKLLFLLVLLLTATTGAWAQTQWTSGDCTVTLNNGTLTVSGNGTMADYADPSDRPWINNIGDITSVLVESGVTSVGMYAFYDCSSLTSVTLPEGLTAIGDMAFGDCSSLTSVTIPSTVTSIGAGAFYNCSAMTSVTLPEGLTAIAVMAFYDCSSLTSVTLPEGLTVIDVMAFWSCSSLTSITIPSTVTSIADFAFYSCSAISDVNIYANPDNLTWGSASMDFKSDKATQCHVLAEHLSTYQNKFSSVNVTFVGDLQPLTPPTYSITLAEGTEDAENWKGKAGEGEYQKLPLEGVAEGAEVTVTYSGEKKVKSVKAVKVAAVTYPLLSAATTSDYGKVVCAAGHLHDAKTAVPDGCTAVGILGKVTETGHGLILSLQNATYQEWVTVNGWASETSYAGTTLKVLPDDAARGTNLTSYTKLGDTAVSNWAVAQKDDYVAIFVNLGSEVGDSDGITCSESMDVYITPAGGTSIYAASMLDYISATSKNDEKCWGFNYSYWKGVAKSGSYNAKNVRPVLGF